MRIGITVVFIWVILLSFSFRPSSEAGDALKPMLKLSEYGLFVGDLADMQPAEGVLPYSLSTPLFSDYALKARFVRLPTGTKVTYHDKDVFDFPLGTILIKTFYFPQETAKANNGKQIIETRLLIRQEKGWKALPYIWNDAQTDAELDVAGATKEVSWRDEAGKLHQQHYNVPNVNECKNCHNKSDVMLPIGPTARQLNSEFTYSGKNTNQLQKWHELGVLEGLPTDFSEVPPAIDAFDKSQPLHERAKTYLDINCAHCHNKQGSASTSGLFLDYYQTDSTAYGYHKPPIAAGRGSGNRRFSIVPGKPNESILLYRMDSTDPGVMMPELGRSVKDEEGIQLIKAWIDAMK